MQTPDERPWPPARAAWITVAILSAAYVLSYVDRIIINLLVEPIKKDLGINDTQFALLTGVAFGLFYTLMGLPLGRLADRASRRSIAAAGVFLFSLATIGSGLAKTFTQMFMARAAVGVGEAAITPVAYSMIADLFPPAKLGRAMAVFTMSAFIGVGLAYIGGGAAIAFLSRLGTVDLPLVGGLEAWHLAFLLAGLPGLIIAPLFFLIPEPARRGAKEQLPVSAVAREITARSRAFYPLFAGYCMVTLAGYAGAVWTPAFFIRTYGWSASETGLWWGLISLIFGPLGAIAGGWICDRLTASGRTDAPLIVAAASFLLSGVFGALGPLMPTAQLAILVMIPNVFLSTMPFPMAGTALQLISPPQIRGQLTGLYMTIINLVGLGLGPLIIGLMNDFVFTQKADVRYSLALLTAVTAPIGYALIARARAPYRAERERSQVLAGPS
jgi:MFS family permease